MKNILMKYIKEDTAAEDIQVVILTVIGLSCAIAIGWWVWNILSDQANSTKCDGNANPFCIE